MKPHIPIFTILAAAFSFLLGLVGNVVAGWVVSAQVDVTPAFLGVIAALAASGAVIAWMWYRRPRYVQATMRPPLALHRDEQGNLAPSLRMYAKQGLIAFVSLYKPMRRTASTPSVPVDQQKLVEQAQAGHYESLDLLNSNLQPVIEAVLTHRSALKKCWLVGTPESLAFAPALVAYLKQQCQVTCEFEVVPPITLEQLESQVTVNTRDQINQIFKQAERAKIDDESIVCDFSGCPRSMTLGMFLACLDSRRDIEFVSTEYEPATVQPKDKLTTILFEYEPVLPDAN